MCPPPALLGPFPSSKSQQETPASSGEFYSNVTGLVPRPSAWLQAAGFHTRF